MRWEAKLCVIIVVIQYNILYKFALGVTARWMGGGGGGGGIKADMESASHIVLQKFKGILHLKTCWGMHRCQWPA